MKSVYTAIGYNCLELSAKQGDHVEEVKALMKDKVCMFSGHSGVGKSTLVNAIDPSLDIKTKSISSQHQQGQHTTTFAQMYDLQFNAKIIDTPGIKGFGIVDMEREEIADYFPEFFSRKPNCKFNNCMHLEEPHCAVKESLEKGEIAWSRYESYLQILEGDEDQYRKDSYGTN